MILQPLSLSQIKDCYEIHLVNDFPSNEVRSLQSIENLYRQGFYKGYGFLKDNRLLAYAFCVHTPTHYQMLLDYYAVIPSHRESGIGSLFLQQLKSQLNVKGLIIEVETPSQLVIAEENQLRLRRIAFYERNGAHLTNIGGEIFGVHFTLMHLPIQEQLSDQDLLHAIQNLYKKMVPSQLYERFVHYQILR